MSEKFWPLAYKEGWCTAEQLAQAVYSANNPFGEPTLTPDKYKELTGLDWVDPFTA